jgi:acyl transferase domain-containing protein
VAAVNGPGSVVVSGDVDALGELVRVCEARGVRTREIAVDYASHSAHVEEIREELLEACAGIVPRAGDVRFYSTATGGPLDMGELDAEYWYRGLRETVRFADVTRALLEEGYRAFVEVSPHPVLVVGVQECVDEVFGTAGGADGERAADGLSGASGARNAGGEGVVVCGSLRRGDGGRGRFMMSLAELWVRGVDVDWGLLFEGSGARRAGLPTYAFQRERYWLAGGGGAGGAAAVGQARVEHPLLGARMALAGERGWVFTGRLSLESHQWLEDHAVLGVPVLPGTAFVELALHVGAELGCGRVQELIVESPLVLGEQGAVQLQVWVGELDESGGRPLGIYSRVARETGADADGDGEWAHHASGTLAAHHARGDRASEAQAVVEGQASRRGERVASLTGALWPPAGAEAVGVDDLYGRLAERGLEYGPVFQGLRAAWRRGDDLFTEVSLTMEEQDRAGSFGLHPALLDGALHTMGVDLRDDRTGGGGERSPRGGGEKSPRGGVRLPFAFVGVELYGPGASSLRVCLSAADGDAVSLLAADETGELVAAVEALTARELPATQLGAARGPHGDSLFALEWEAIPASPASPFASAYPESLVVLGAESSALAKALSGVLDAESALAQAPSGATRPVAVHTDLGALGDALGEGRATPGAVLVDCAPDDEGDSGGLGRVHRTAQRVLGLVQGWLADERFAGVRLVLVTRGALAARPGDGVPDLAGAPVWGLVRSAQSEHPGRCVLVDVDGSESAEALAAALGTGEPQLAVRKGGVLVPRLVRVRREPDADLPRFAGAGTVLITGGTGTLGGLLARHLVTERGVGHLLLASRRGPTAEGAPELWAELEALGARVTIAACDVADREHVKLLLDAIPAEHPLSGVVHVAGALDDGVIGSLSAERLDGVLAPKADAAWHLHELTAHLDLGAFVLFSSAAGTLGSPGQGNYAAANAFLDSLAAYRRARGLAGVSIAWGLWEQASEITGGLSAADRARMSRAGLGALASARALELFDAAVDVGEAFMLCAPLDLPALRAQARTGVLPALLGGLVRMPARRSAEQGASLKRRLAAAAGDEREGVALEAVRGEVAIVLGHASAGAIGRQQTFRELGFDSLSAVELRNRLNTLTGLQLPATLVFDYPTPAAIVGHLLECMSLDSAAGDRDRYEAEIRQAIASVPLVRLRNSGLLDLLLGLAGSGDSTSEGPHSATGASKGDAATLIREMDVESLVEKALAGSHRSEESQGTTDGGR